MSGSSLVRFGVVMAMATALLGCPSDPEKKTLTHRGLDRSYRVTIPTGYTPDEPVPLLVALHGLAGDSAQFDSLTRFGELAERDGFIAVFPEAVASAWRFPDYNVRMDDVAFVSLVIDAVTNQYEIDLERIYLTGFSHGGILSYQLACEYPGRFAALAAVSSLTMPEIPADACPDALRMPVLMIEGDQELVWANANEELVILDNLTFEFVPAIRSPRFWSSQNNCGVDIDETLMPDLDPEDGTVVIRRLGLDCDPGSAWEYYQVIGGGHNWPGSPENNGGGYGNVTYDINASDTVWEFLSQYRLGDRAAMMDAPNFF